MFKTVFGDKLVTNFLFDADFSENPRLPSPYQLQHKIIIKNRKMIAEPSVGLPIDIPINANNTSKQDRYFSDSSTIDDELDEFLDNQSDDGDECTDIESIRIPTIRMSPRRTSSVNSFISERTNSRRTKKQVIDDGVHSDCKTDEEAIPSGQTTRRAASRLPIGQIAPELSEIVIYSQAVKYKAHMKHFVSSNTELLEFKYDAEQRTISSSFGVPKMRSNAPSLLSDTPLKLRRQKSSSQMSLKSNEENSAAPTTITTMNHANTTADCYKTTSVPGMSFQPN